MTKFFRRKKRKKRLFVPKKWCFLAGESSEKYARVRYPRTMTESSDCVPDSLKYSGAPLSPRERVLAWTPSFEDARGMHSDWVECRRLVSAATYQRDVFYVRSTHSRAASIPRWVLWLRSICYRSASSRSHKPSGFFMAVSLHLSGPYWTCWRAAGRIRDYFPNGLATLLHTPLILLDPPLRLKSITCFYNADIVHFPSFPFPFSSSLSINTNALRNLRKGKKGKWCSAKFGL